VGGQANPDRRQALTASGAALATLLAGCASAARPAARTSAGRQPASARAHNGPPAAPAGGDEDPAVIAGRVTVPVLCWHQLRDWQPSDTGYARRLLICPPGVFRAQLDALACARATPPSHPTTIWRI